MFCEIYRPNQNIVPLVRPPPSSTNLTLFLVHSTPSPPNTYMYSHRHSCLDKQKVSIWFLIASIIYFTRKLYVPQKNPEMFTVVTFSNRRVSNCYHSHTAHFIHLMLGQDWPSLPLMSSKTYPISQEFSLHGNIPNSPVCLFVCANTIILILNTIGTFYHVSMWFVGKDTLFTTNNSVATKRIVMFLDVSFNNTLYQWEGAVRKSSKIGGSVAENRGFSRWKSGVQVHVPGRQLWMSLPGCVSMEFWNRPILKEL